MDLQARRDKGVPRICSSIHQKRGELDIPSRTGNAPAHPDNKVWVSGSRHDDKNDLPSLVQCCVVEGSYDETVRYRTAPGFRLSPE